jgi:hypothetical protein
MTNDPLSVFGLGTTISEVDAVQRLGYPRNPFLLTDEDASHPPFYSRHIERELKAVGDWVRDAIAGQRLPLSIVGNIGVGKSRILSTLKDGLQARPPCDGLVVDKIGISDSGYGKASLGSLLVTSLERVVASGRPAPPDNTIEFVWAIANAATAVSGSTPLRRALALTQAKRGDVRVNMAIAISRWLARGPLTTQQASSVGLERKIDWEGALIPVVGDLLMCAKESGVLTAYFLLIDQLEDLFTKAFSELRRSRLLTDLRGLMDQIDAGVPMALLLTFGPETSGQSTNAELARNYAALSSRIERNKIDLALFERAHAVAFATTYIERLKGHPAFDPQRQPNVADLVDDAWNDLLQQKRVYASDRTTPRDLLKALAAVVKRRAETRP